MLVETMLMAAWIAAALLETPFPSAPPAKAEFVTSTIRFGLNIGSGGVPARARPARTTTRVTGINRSSRGALRNDHPERCKVFRPLVIALVPIMGTLYIQSTSSSTYRTELSYDRMAIHLAVNGHSRLSAYLFIMAPSVRGSTEPGCSLRHLHPCSWCSYRRCR